LISSSRPSASTTPPFPYTTLFRSQSAYYKSRQGLEGERKLFNLLRNQLSSDHIPMYGLLLNNYGTIIQLDCLLIFPSKVNKQSRDRKSTRLNSSHVSISYAVFCLK